MALKLFNQTVSYYLTLDNTVASAGMAATGGQGGGDFQASEDCISSIEALPVVPSL